MKTLLSLRQRGFTLIELLVVVLIIGILATIALPQYEKVVEKSRAAEAWQTMGSLAQAIQARILEDNGSDEFEESTHKWDLLNISLPLTDSSHYNARQFGMKESQYFTYSLESVHYVRAYRGHWGADDGSGGTWWNSDHDYDLFLDLDGKTWDFSKPGTRLCGAITAKGRNICSSLGTWVSGDKYRVGG